MMRAMGNWNQDFLDAVQAARSLNVRSPRSVNASQAAEFGTEDLLRALVSQLTLAEQRERRRLAQELHDSLQQMLYGCSLKLARVRRMIDSEEVNSLLEESRETIQEALDFCRTLVTDLYPRVLYEHGLSAGIEQLAAEMRGLNLAVEVHEEGEPQDLPEDLLTLLFQSVREMLFNTVKHSEATRAKVATLWNGDELRIVVADPGIGFDPADSGRFRNESQGFGLFQIEQRLHSLGGGLEVLSAPGRGTTLTLVVPVSEMNPEAPDAAERIDREDVKS